MSNQTRRQQQRHVIYCRRLPYWCGIEKQCEDLWNEATSWRKPVIQFLTKEITLYEDWKINGDSQVRIERIFSREWSKYKIIIQLWKTCHLIVIIIMYTLNQQEIRSTLDVINLLLLQENTHLNSAIPSLLDLIAKWENCRFANRWKVWISRQTVY